MWPITCFIASADGREAFIRSCALRILEAETISSARVTLRVFCTLLILVLISLPPAMFSLALLASGGLGSRDWGLGKCSIAGCWLLAPNLSPPVPLHQLPVALKSPMPSRERKSQL